jgi:IclR family mhp operon transcriptional activator
MDNVADVDDGLPIRAISRAIAVIRAVNNLENPKLADIAKACNMPYPTAYRIAQTLMMEGILERDDASRRYRPAEGVLSLAQGYKRDDAMIGAARPHLESLTSSVIWPVSLVTRLGSSMIVRASTHAQTSLTFNDYQPGFALPVLGCASGLVYLAFADQKERSLILNGLRLMSADIDIEPLLHIERGYILGKVSEDGFALITRNPNTRSPGKTSSIAMPLFYNGRVIAALTLIFFAAAMKPSKAIQSYIEPMRETVAAIQAAWSALEPGAY